ncbi:MAG: tetratricopeptide repeat protein [Promethearchaeota archaeon]
MASTSEDISTYLFKLDSVVSDTSGDYGELLHEHIVFLINGEQYDHLVELCQEVLRFDPYIPLIKKIVFTLINLNEGGKAIAICRAYVKLVPEQYLVIKVIEEFLRYNNYSGAIDTCKMYLMINKKDVLGIIPGFIMDFLESNDQFNEIFQLIEIFLDLNPEESKNLIHNMIEIRNYQVAVYISKLVLDLNLEDLEMLYEIVKLLSDNGEGQGALEICKKILEHYPKTPELMILYGYAFISMRKFHNALTLFNDALANVLVDSGLKSEILNNIGRTYFCLGDMKKASWALRKAITLNPKLSYAHANLGVINYKKGYKEKGIKSIEKAITLEHNNCRAWANLGQIHFELCNYNLAFKACHSCLSINNQHQDGILLYKKLYNNPTLIILNYIVSKLKKFGYRCGFNYFNENLFPKELLEKHGYISYSKEYQSFLRGTDYAVFNDVVAIYSWLPTCDKCNHILKSYGERVDYKTKQRITYYRCEKCGSEKKEIYDLQDSNVSYIKIRVILNSVSLFPERKNTQVRYNKLDHEKLFITYTYFDEILKDRKSHSDLLSNLSNAVLLYGQDIR